MAETIHSPTLTDTISYQYDKNGNLTQKTNQNGVLARYHYTTDNKLSLIEQGNLTIRYAYDSQGNRIQSITTDSSQTTPKTETVAYLVDNNFSYPEVIEEQDAQGKLITSNTFVPKGVGDLLSINRANQGTYYASEDALGSLRQLTNTQGKVEAQQQTTAWGEVLPVSNVSQYTAYGYTGERQDAQTGLVYLRAREYAANVGRFVQRDEYSGNITNPITLNKQIYANSNPLKFTDPSGNFGLAEATVVNTIVQMFTQMEVDSGFDILDRHNGSGTELNTVRTVTQIMGVASLGAAGYNLFTSFSKVGRAFKSATGKTNFKDLNGLEFEKYLTMIGGKKAKPSFIKNAKEFDGEWDEKFWYEAKSGWDWLVKLPPEELASKLHVFKSSLGKHKAIAKQNGRDFFLISKTPIPDFIKEHCAIKGIKYIEML